jgi:chromosome segregation ATPase
MGSVETNAAIRMLFAQLVERVNDPEVALLVQQVQRHLQEHEKVLRQELSELESQFREERAQLVAELKALLPQAARERDEARAKARELEAKNLALETRIKALEPKAGLPKQEPKPLSVRAPISSRDFDVL